MQYLEVRYSKFEVQNQPKFQFSMEDRTLRWRAFDSKDLALAFFKEKFGKDADKTLVLDNKYSSGKQRRYTCAGGSLLRYTMPMIFSIVQGKDAGLISKLCAEPPGNGCSHARLVYVTSLSIHHLAFRSIATVNILLQGRNSV